MNHPTALADSVAEYEANGCVAAGRLDTATVDELRASIDRISKETRPEVVYEAGGDVVRALHGCHRFDAACAELVRHPMLLDLAEAVLGGPVYVYQFKVNVKQPREGKEWPWHQDYPFWHHEDGMPAPRALNIGIFLDDVHEDNGPLTVLPGTHRLGIIESPGAVPPAKGGDWRDHVSEKLTYTVDDARAAELERDHPSRALLGPAGTVVAFHPSLLHSSTNNPSETRRALLLITYNAVDNVPAHVTRPEFLVDRDTTPLERR
ncbi:MULTISPECIES: phytanoyl-CoA dioxygenase family protein [Actinomadura]|uniref:Phytanoyl-CoA dioxygenase n=2 Tax=Actinomadura litoris TaxID=2678616 RepID=A0A7K1KXA2_9ACTN|nr:MULTISPECIES: phytanoyl-CoA dioxygenase family protein [Actinomadura]MBT2209345.1 phytanoyl-CoA dioxygenase family protein [Actinomadura sp. NEAU-AAG7]MUN36838.1 phytanoyl-CoA dioxygenase [Actinomadura litoris]